MVEAYLLAYNRSPNSEERQIAIEFLSEGDQRRRSIEDLFWTLLNTPEFSFVD